MPMGLPPHVVLLGVSVSFCAFLAVYSWRQLHVLGARAFFVLMVCGAIWSGAYILEILTGDLATKLLWLNVQQIGIYGAPVGWALLALAYTGRSSWLTKRHMVLLSLAPLLTVLLLWSNGLHGWMRTDVFLRDAGRFYVVGTMPTALLYSAFAYNLVLLVAGLLLLIKHTYRASRLYRRQGCILISAMLIPLGLNLMDIFGKNPWAPFGPTTVAFIPMSLLLFYGLFKGRLLDLWPVARDSVIESMEDGLLVVDDKKRVVDMNASCQRLLHVDDSRIGVFVGELLSAYPDWSALFGEPVAARVKHMQTQTERGPMWLEVRVSPLEYQGKEYGWVSILRDITTEERTRRELHSVYERLNEELTAARHVHQRLLQTSIPGVKGFSLAAVCTPATYTGGDFYQVIHKDNILVP